MNDCQQCGARLPAAGPCVICGAPAAAGAETSIPAPTTAPPPRPPGANPPAPPAPSAPTAPPAPVAPPSALPLADASGNATTGAPGTAEGPTPGDRCRRGNRLALAVSVAVLVALIAGAAAVVLARRGGSDTGSDDAALHVELVAADEAGADPFTPSAAADAAVDFSTVEPGSANASTTAAAGAIRIAATSGTSAGLYGSKAEGGATSICDVAKLQAALAADQEAATAWTDLMEVEPGQIGETLDGLTPVVLGRDTIVTNTAYRKGKARTFPAILQSGTPVLVDASGMPRVKCSCGNPLLAPPTDEATTKEIVLDGPRWSRFDERQVTMIDPASTPASQIETVDVDTGKTVDVETGGPLPLDGYLVLDTDGVHVVSADGTSKTTVIDHEVATAYDDGEGGLIYQELRTLPATDGGPVTTSFGEWNLAAATPASAAEGTIWHLPAGAREPVPLVASDDPSHQFAGLLAVGRLGDRNVMAYSSATVVSDPYDSYAEADLVLRDLDSGEDHVLADTLWGYEGMLGNISITPTMVAWTAIGEGMTSWTAVDANLEPIATPCSEVVEDPDPGCGDGRVDDEGRIVSPTYSDTRESMGPLQVTDLRTGAAQPSVTQFDSPYLGDGMVTPRYDAAGSKILLSTRTTLASDATVVGPQAAQIIDLAAPRDQKATTLPLTGEVRFLTAPLRVR